MAGPVRRAATWSGNGPGDAGYVLALVGITLLSGERTFADHPAQFLLLLQNYDPALFQTFVPTAWTLVLEMTFYLALPIVAVAFLPVVRADCAAGLMVCSRSVSSP